MQKHIVPFLAEPVGLLWKQLQENSTKKGEFFIASPLSSTPLPIYQWIIEHSAEFSNWEKVKFVLMDEMLDNNTSPFKYVPTNDPANYEGFAKKHFLNLLQEKTGISTEVIKPSEQNIATFTTRIDLLILAIGVKGNYANVMPGTPESTAWHIAHLIPEFRQSHTQQGSDSYEGAHFREYGMSLGPQQVMTAKNVVIIISGEKKRKLTQELLAYTDFDPTFPLSIIYHPSVRDKVSLYITEDAC